MKLILAGLLRLISLEKYYAATFVAGSQVVARLVEFDRGDDIRFGYILDITLVAKAPGKTPL